MITLTLPHSFVGQILDVLYEEQGVWSYTRSYLLGGPVDINRLIKEDATDNEAYKMYMYYQEIIDAVKRQY
ncbi:MAG: hypothetical protein QGG25_01060 [Phycisphaerae bacterium]|nr:hypothetical protein [Phycisphaerae bacterium]